MSRIWDQDFGDNEDVVADGIMAHLSTGKKVFLEELYNQDVAARAEGNAVPEQNSGPDQADPLTPPPCPTPSPGEMWDLMKTMMESGFNSVISWQDKVEVQLAEIVVWLGNLEEEVKTLKNNNKGKEKVVESESEGRREDENNCFGEGTSAHPFQPSPASPVAPAFQPSPASPIAHPFQPSPASPIAPAEPSPIAPAESSPIAPAEPSPIAPAEPSPIAPAEPSPIAPAEPSPIAPAEPSPVAPAEPSKKRKTRSSKYVNTPFTEWKKKGKNKGNKEGSKEGNKEGNKKGKKK